jgi:hypothetical protein
MRSHASPERNRSSWGYALDRTLARPPQRERQGRLAGVRAIQRGAGFEDTACPYE